jgi:hypothetical protein
MENFEVFNVSDEDIDKITHQNALRLYHFEPFKYIPKEQATVGALRNAAVGHDVQIRALSSHDRTKSDTSMAEFQVNAKAVADVQE